MSKLADDTAARDSIVEQLSEMAAHEDDRERRLRELALDTLRLLAVGNLENWRSIRTSGGSLESELDTASFLADVFCRVCAKFGNRN